MKGIKLDVGTRLVAKQNCRLYSVAVKKNAIITVVIKNKLNGRNEQCWRLNDAASVYYGLNQATIHEEILLNGGRSGEASIIALKSLRLAYKNENNNEDYND